MNSRRLLSIWPRCARADRVLASIVLAALVVRAAWLLRSGSDWAVATDSIGYLALAHGIRDGCGFAAMANGCGAPEVLRTPGYPLFLVPFLNHYRLAIFVQAVFGAAVCGVVAAFTKRQYGAVAAIIAAAIVAFDPPTITVTKELLTEPLFQLVLAGAVFGSLCNHALAAGLLYGAAALVRPVAEPLLILAPVSFLLSRRWIRAAGVLCLALVIIGAWAARNYRVAGVFALTIEGPMNLYSYTVPAVVSLVTGVPLIEAQRAAAHAVESAAFGDHADLIAKAHQLSPHDEISWAVETSPQVAHLMLSRSIDVIASHPIATAEVTAIGFLRLAFEPHEPAVGLAKMVNGGGPAFQVVKIGSMALEAALLCFIWIGVARAMWIYRSDDQLWILLGIALLLLLAASPYLDVFDPRYRVPAIPFLATIAGVGWANLASLVRPGICADPATIAPGISEPRAARN